MSELTAALTEALEVLQSETGLDPDQLFGERLLEPTQLSPAGAHAFGIIEGAAIALGLTAIELLDDLVPIFIPQDLSAPRSRPEPRTKS